MPILRPEGGLLLEPAVEVARSMGVETRGLGDVAYVSYTDPDGIVWPFSDVASGFAVVGVANFGSPPMSPSVKALPGGGGYVSSIARSPAQPIVHVTVSSPTVTEQRAKVRALRRAMSHQRGLDLVPGVLTATWPDGVTRSIDVFCQDGMEEADELPDDLTVADFVLQFIGPDGFWRDSADRSLSFAIAGAFPFFPFLPLRLNPSNVLGDSVVTNDGDVEAWPLWEMVGPGLPSAANLTTGQAWSFEAALADGERVFVDTRPPGPTGDGGPAVYDDTGANRWESLSLNDQALWALAHGDNQVSVLLVGATASSSMTMRWRRRWLGA